MEVNAADVLKQPWPEFGSCEAGLDQRLFGDGPTEWEKIKEEKTLEEEEKGNKLPTINEELAKIFPESAHKFLKDKPSGKRGRPRKYPKIEKTTNRGRGRPRKVESTGLDASLPAVPKARGKVGRPRKVPQTKMSAEVPVKETNMEEEITKEQEREWTFESSIEREKLRKRPRLSYVDAYIDEVVEEEEEEEGDVEGEVDMAGDVDVEGEVDVEGDVEGEVDVEGDVEGEVDTEGEDSNDDVSEASFEESHSESENYDESESGFESDDPAYVEKKKQKCRKKKDFLEENLPKYRILKDTQGNQAGLSRYQILKVRLLKFQATKGRGRPLKKFKIAGAKRGRGRPRKDEMKNRTLKVSLERLSDLHIDSRNRSVKGLKKQGQAYLLSQYNGLKRKRGRPKKVKVETKTEDACGNSSASLETPKQQSLEPSPEPSLEPSCSNVKSEKNVNSPLCDEESSKAVPDTDSESKKEKKKKKRKKIRTRRDSISKMTSVSVSVERLENIFDLQLLQDTQTIKVKEDEEDMYERKESIYVCERQEAEDIGIKQDIDDFTVKEEADQSTDEQMEEDDQMTNAQDEMERLIDTQNYYLNQEMEEYYQNLQSEVKENKSTDGQRTSKKKIQYIENAEHRRVTYARRSRSLIVALTSKKRGRPPKHDNVLFDNTVKHCSVCHQFPKSPGSVKKLNWSMKCGKKTGIPPKEGNSIKRGRGRPRKNPEIVQEVVSDLVPPYTSYPEQQMVVNRGRGRPKGSSKSNELKKSLPGRPRGRPKGRKNKQLEYERLIADIEYTEKHRNEQEGIKTDDIGDDIGDTVKWDGDSHISADTSKSDPDQQIYSLVSKPCTFADDKMKSPVNVPSDLSYYIAELNESDMNSPQNIFNDIDTDDEDGGKLITNQSVFHPFPVGTGFKTHDSGPLPVVTDSETRFNGFSQSCSEFKKSEKVVEENQSDSEAEFKPSDSDEENSQVNQSEKHNLETQSTVTPSDSSFDMEKNESVSGSRMKREASIDSDYFFLNVNSDQSGENVQQNFSGGLLDDTASTDPDFIDDDYLLAF